MKRAVITIFFVSIMIFTLSACNVGGVEISMNSQQIKGSGTVTTQEREVSNFTQVELKSIGNLTIKQGQPTSLTIKADDNLMQYITTDVEEGTLEIGMQPNVNVDPTSTIEYTLVVDSLSSVQLSGFGNITADELSGDEINVVLAGSGDITIGTVDATKVNMQLTGFGNITTNEVKTTDSDLSLTGSGDINIGKFNAAKLDATISGFGNASISGSVDDQVFRLTGSGSFKGGDLQSQTANITISGFGDATVWAEQDLDLTITGSGTVNYYGDPHLNQTITGMGKIKSLGSH